MTNKQGIMATLELPLLSSMTSNASNRSSSNVDIVIEKENELSKQHDRVHLRCNISHYILLLLIGAAYFAYGYHQYTSAQEVPSIHSYQQHVETYPLPTSLACIQQNNSFLAINTIYINHQIVNITKQIDFSSVNSFTLDSSNNDWQIINGHINELQMKCLMIIPPSNIKYTSLYQIEYIYWSQGFVDSDPYLLNTLGLKQPNFMTMQDKYFMFHTHFHIDDFMEDRKMKSESIGDDNISTILNTILFDAFEFGEPFYTTAFSFNAMRLQLEQTTKIDETVLNSFDVGSNAKLTSFHKYLLPNCTLITNDICSLIVIQYNPRAKDGGFVVKYNIEYSSYTWPDLLSGLGGILSGANGLMSKLFFILLFGIPCIKFNGIAPYPTLDDNFKQRIQREIMD